MGNQITLAYSNDFYASPGDLYGGEVAINASSKKIWCGNSGSSNTAKTLVFDDDLYPRKSDTTSVSTNNVANKLVRRNASGTIYITNINATGNAGFASLSVSTPESTSLSYLWGRQSSNSYLRPYAAGTIRTWLGVNQGSTIPTGGSSGKFLEWASDGTAQWCSDITIAEAARTQMGVAPGPSGTPGLTDVNFTSTLKTKLDGITEGATVNTNVVVNNTVTSTSTTAAASANSVRTAYDLAASKSTAPNNAQANVGIQFNGAGAGSGMNVNSGYISHYSGTPFNHIPANGTSGQVLGWHSSGKAQWVAAGSGYTLPDASSSVRGGVKIGYTPTATVEHAVQTTASGQMYVVVNNHTTTWNGLQNISALTALP
jgi:hypothetical protein